MVLMFVSSKTHESVKKMLEQVTEQLKKTQQHAYLLDVERAGRAIKFTFVRNGEVHQIETVGTISDNVKEWKDKLIR